MKKTISFIAGLLLALTGMAQENKGGISGFMKEELEDFDKFMDDADKDFINFMREPWKEFEAEKPVLKWVKPEPVKPVVYDEKTAPKSEKPVCLTIEEILDMTTSEGKQKPVVQLNEVDRIVFDKPEVIVRKKKDPKVIIIEEKAADKPTAQPEKKPVVEVVEAEPEAEPAPVVEAGRRPEPAAESRLPVSSTPMSPLYRGESGRSKIAYGGLAFYLNNSLNRKCSLNGLNENAIADAYEALCNSDYKPLLADCAQIRKDLRLNDWGVFTLVRQVADTYCGTANESIVMQQFLLNEMGYKARMARKATEDKMMLFVATDCSIYAHPYITLNGQNYYNLSGNNEQCQFYMCQKDSPKAKNSVGMQLKEAPLFPGTVVSSTHQAKGSAARVTVDVPKALMDFYKDYPQCDYSVYFNAPVNAAMENRILSSLAPLVQGRNEADAANILINFVQTAFQYQTDGQQFGYEKPFFVEELFYYPYSDCEDRAMLFSYLVRKLLGLDVVLLDYPEHIATAVRFNGNVSGDYLMVNGRKYIVCDPTYIGASIGMTMPRYKTVSAKVLKY
ncbi:hypothetical protein F9959_04205 [Bacteroides stercoris]|mgnify:FL=1|jgi:hypothetical protein|uniref:Transglutaminase domain-containing protein n=1 Tax=Bacteroides stercoris TaxID=46506 RepID=A0A414KW22_BACSE|nr:hypothetical protein [Bacteroides stercoris]KAB5264486.1 hypothetical protein F9968_04770 [Bacteroides stercoris]KAB5264611.1 hypothetical protein F9966_04150 [Bacteroides stercoris]KAB5282158.1 hypothetical protein F9962_06655 [Bacteroides stercoris]KAB5286241.1 hypothetical protein F9957_04785 [Bacteroides stercoris]KAB5289759.1 hypothetical protein F9964_01980 [Bacteroides stercoris]